MIDISDGLLADLAHLTGELGAEIRCNRLPTSPALAEAVPGDATAGRCSFPAAITSCWRWCRKTPNYPASVGGIELTEIGRITDSDGIECLDEDGKVFETSRSGWDHFG